MSFARSTLRALRFLLLAAAILALAGHVCRAPLAEALVGGPSHGAGEQGEQAWLDSSSSSW
jgi:hypothetical protein